MAKSLDDRIRALEAWRASSVGVDAAAPGSESKSVTVTTYYGQDVATMTPDELRAAVIELGRENNRLIKRIGEFETHLIRRPGAFTGK